MNSYVYTLPALFAGGLVCGMGFTSYFRIVAIRLGLVDRPDAQRKLHRQATPVAGGIAVLAAAVLVLGVAAIVPGPIAAAIQAAPIEWGGLLLGAVIICAIGVVDDARGLPGKYKLAGQLVAVFVVLLSGVRIGIIELFGWHIDLGWFAVPITTLWLLGAINSLNLIDGMDGLLGTIATIICVTVSILAAMFGHIVEACVAIVLAGSLVGFLRYNLPPASIFMGDAGSMLVGLVIGVLAVRSSLKGPATVAMAAPAALLIVPFFDTLSAVVRRKLTGRSLYSTDRGHLHHVLLQTGLSRPRVLALVSALCTIAGVGVLASIAYRNEVLAILAAATVVTILLVTRLFGYAEFVLLMKSAKAQARSILGFHDGGRVIEARIQGSARWGDLWGKLTGSVEQLNLRTISLDVNAPFVHEGYHAKWRRPRYRLVVEGYVWSAVLPLSAWGQSVGQIAVTGYCDTEPIWKKVAALTSMTGEIEALLILSGATAPAHPLNPTTVESPVALKMATAPVALSVPQSATF